MIGLTAASAPAAAADLVPQGKYYWDEAGDVFGGFSGLVMLEGGTHLIVVSDRGVLFRAAVARNGSGRIRRIETEWQAGLLDNFGKPVDDFGADAEALAMAADGTLYIGFESYARVSAIRLPEMKPEPLHDWDRFRESWGNAGFEGLAVLPDGSLLAVHQKADAGRVTTVLMSDGAWRTGPDLPASPGYDVADATVGPDGLFYLLERRFAYLAGYATRIRRFAYAHDGFGDGQVLLDTAPGALDNMEGISLWTDERGRTIVSLISDDNFLPIQNTILVEYELRE